MYSDVHIKSNNLPINQELSSSNNLNTPPSINVNNVLTAPAKTISNYKIINPANESLNLVDNLITEGNYQDLAKLLQKDKTIIAKILALPEYQSPLITAITNKQHPCADILVNAILQYAKTNTIADYIQKYLFIYACKQPDFSISAHILRLYSNTSINLTAIQVKYLLTEAINSNNENLLKLLIQKFIMHDDDKEEKYVDLIQYAIQKNNQKIFTFLVSNTKNFLISIFNTDRLKQIIPNIIESNNIYYLKFLIIQAISTNNINVLFNITYTLAEYKEMSVVFHIVSSYPQLLWMKKKQHIRENHKTIFHIIFHHANPKYTVKLLELPLIKQHINNPFYCINLCHKGKYNLAEMALTNCRKSQAKNINLSDINRVSVIELPIVRIKKMHQIILDNKIYQSKTFDYLDLETRTIEKKSAEILTEVATNITNISSIGIYLYTYSFTQKNQGKGQSHCFGDENATMNMIDRLVFLGCKKIHLYCVSHHNIDEHNKKVMLKKISYLLNLDDTTILDNIINKDQCEIRILFFQQGIDNINMTEDITLTFSQHILFQHVKNIKNVINLKPFLFGKNFEEMCIKNKTTDNTENENYKIIALNNPTYSILQEAKNNLPSSYNYISNNKKWLYSLLVKVIEPTQANLLAECIANIANNINQINHGVIYGLHHNDVTNKVDILNNWLNLLKQLTNEKNDKPVVLSIPANNITFNIQSLPKQAFVFDLINKTYEPQEIDQAFKAKQHIIFLYPTLPKIIFYYLINKANVPILLEGANTTSYALQQGIPYLSVLPTGMTPIPAKMGDPLQALLIEAMSYKITLNPIYLEFTKKIFDFVSVDNYKDAIDLIEKLHEKDYKSRALRFFYRNDLENLDDIEYKLPYKDKITVLSLLKRALLSPETVKQHLLQILNPNMQSVIDYAQQCKNPDSAISWHVKLMQHHVNLEINNTVDISLHKFFKQFGNT